MDRGRDGKKGVMEGGRKVKKEEGRGDERARRNDRNYYGLSHLVTHCMHFIH